MKIIFIAILVAMVVVGQSAFATEQDDYTALKISEIQLGSAASAGEEYIEIANTSVDPLDMAGVIVQYKSATGVNWSVKAELSGMIAPYGRFLISNYLEQSSQPFNGGLSGTSGHIRIVIEETVLDTVGWGAADEPESMAIETHGHEQSLKRRVDEDGRLIDTQDNSTDWFISEAPSPTYDSWVAEIVTESEDDSVAASEPSPTNTTPKSPPKQTGPAQSTAKPTNSARLVLTEIYPDPVKPQTDAEHEFIEIKNPNDYAVDTAGYVIQSGSDWKYSHTLGSYNLKPGEFIALYSGDTGLVLANGGGQVHILGPDGEEKDILSYGKAPSGQSYSLINGEWQWVEEATNNDTNVAGISADTLNSSDATALEKKDVSYPGSNSTDASAQNDGISNTSKNEEDQPINNWVLAVAALLAVLYAIYEYRTDIRLRFQQYQRYLALRRENRQKS